MRDQQPPALDASIGHGTRNASVGRGCPRGGAFLVIALLALLPLSASSADSAKTLQNVKGVVSYGPGNPGTPLQNRLAPKSAATLSDNDWVATGADSLAAITLPDSSQIVMDANSTVQMTSFNQSDNIPHAKFVVVGKIRFDVKHPNGEKADYQFMTSIGQIAVRGTVGYILTQPGGMEVVVVQASQPVVVTLAIGQVFTVAAGQSLVVTTVAGAVTASVGTASQSMLSSLLSDANLSSSGVSVTPTTAGAAGAGAGAGSGAAGASVRATGAVGAGAAGTAAAAAAVVTQSAQPESSTKQYRMNLLATQELEGKGEGYLIPRMHWVDHGLNCYYGQYYWLYPNGGTEVGNIPWPFCFDQGSDPIAHGVRKFPFPLPMHGYQLPAGTYLYPIEKDMYQWWLAHQELMH